MWFELTDRGAGPCANPVLPDGSPERHAQQLQASLEVGTHHIDSIRADNGFAAGDLPIESNSRLSCHTPGRVHGYETSGRRPALLRGEKQDHRKAAKGGSKEESAGFGQVGRK